MSPVDDPDDREDMQAAHTSRIERSVRAGMLAEMEDALRLFARGNSGRARAVTDAIAASEQASHRADRLNVPALLAVEAALLILLRALARTAQT